MIKAIINAPASNLPVIGTVQFSFDPKPPVAEVVRMVAAIGATALRVEVPWSDSELQKGAYAMPAYVGGLIDAMRSSGRSVVLVLDYGNRLYPGSGAWDKPPRDAESCDAFARYAAWLVDRYAAPDVWFEVYNEPNNAMFWAGASSAAQYAFLLSKCVQAMRAVPGKGLSAQILSAGVGIPGSAGSIDHLTFMRSVSAYVGDRMAFLSAQAIHPYNSQRGPEALFDFIEAYRAAVPYAGPLAVTEWGYTKDWIKGDETTRAIYTARMIGCAIFAGVKVLNVYGLHDTGINPKEPEHNSGLFRFDRTAKPAVTAFKVIMDALAGAVSYSAEKDGSVYKITLKRDAGVVVKVIWSDGTIANYATPMSSLTSSKDTSGGNRWAMINGGNAMVQVGAALHPVVIVGT